MQKIPIEIGEQLYLIKIVWMGLANLETSFLNELKIDANKKLWFNNIIWFMLCIMVNDKKRRNGLEKRTVSNKNVLFKTYMIQKTAKD